MKTFMIFDVDYPGAAFAAGDANLPAPTFTVVNLKNGHAHLIYALESPVCVSKNGGPKPRRYLNAIETAFAFMLGADRRYSGLICKNPFNAHWDTFFSGADYSLSELADYADLSSLSRACHGEGLEPLGRNCDIFDRLRLWSYDAVREYRRAKDAKDAEDMKDAARTGYDAWSEAVKAKAVEYNCQLERPLYPNELKHIVRSVAAWTWKKFTPDGLRDLIARTHTPDVQRARRAKLTEKQNGVKEQGLRLIEQGFSISKIAKALGVSTRTVERWRINNKNIS